MIPFPSSQSNESHSDTRFSGRSVLRLHDRSGRTTNAKISSHYDGPHTSRDRHQTIDGVEHRQGARRANTCSTRATPRLVSYLFSQWGRQPKGWFPSGRTQGTIPFYSKVRVPSIPVKVSLAESRWHSFQFGCWICFSVFSSRGYGTLCVADLVPRKFKAVTRRKYGAGLVLFLGRGLRGRQGLARVMGNCEPSPKGVEWFGWVLSDSQVAEGYAGPGTGPTLISKRAFGIVSSQQMIQAQNWGRLRNHFTFYQ